MTKRKLEEHIEAHYREQSLSPEVRRRLEGMAEVADAGPSGARRWAVALAAGVAAIGVWVGLGGLSIPPASGEAIAAEIAANHRKAEAGEFRVAGWSEINGLLPRLDFDVVPVARLTNRGAAPVSVRYCSLAGQVAVQVEVAGPSGERLTLYQTRAEGRLSHAPEGRFEFGAVEVELWSTGGVLIGVAEDPGRS